MAYNTGNAPGSTDPRDLSDSSGDIDEWATSKTKLMHPDRLGVQRKTWHGMESDFAEALDSYQEQVNDIVIAGGQIFSDEATGRAAVVDDAYYLSEGDSENVATILWQRINASTSRRVADNPTVDYVSMAVQIARDAGHKFAYPNVDYALNYPVEMTVDYDFNLITAVDADGGVMSVQRHADSAVQYPNTTFSDSQMSATVDRSGGVIDSKTLRQAFGQYAAYPYQSFAETGELKKVAANGAVIGEPPRWGGRVFVELDGSTNDLLISWPHGKGKMLRVNYRPNGVNNLFNWRSTEIADLGDPSRANWNAIASTNSDSWPPLIFEAVNNGDGGSQIYTGGNHSSDGGTGGVPTAYMSSIEFAVDGRRLRLGESFSGYADSVQALWRNEIMAFNTITLDRYPITQEIRCEFYAGDISGFVAITANEPVVMGLDNGPQMFSNGYGTYHYYDGQQQATLPIPTSGTNTSGVFSSYPAWACVFSSPEYGFHGAWLDREFEAGDGRYVSGSAGAFRKGSGSKFYSVVVGTGDVHMVAGDSYQYHGGYFWSPADAVSGDVDSAFTFHKRGEPCVGFALTTSGSGAIYLPLWTEGKEVANVGVSGVNGINVSASEYTTFDPAIISSFGLRRENQTGTQPMDSIEGLAAALDEISPKNNLEATAAPTSNDDSTEGYRALSIWVFGTTLYRCVNATPGTAVWVDTGISAEDLGTAAFESDEKYAHRSNNLSDVNAAQARANLGLGAAAQQPLETFDPAGAAEAAYNDAIQRDNHTGTQPLSTISDAGAAASRGVVGGAGDLLANGAYGLGGQGYLLTDFDAPPDRNEFYIGAGTSATGDHGGAAYWPGIDLYRASSDRGARLMFSNEYMRFRGWEGADTVTDFLVYHDKNILGTVSQSEGIPTGAIIERGSNANGSYVKFADGTLECTRIVNLEVQATEASDSLFRSAGVSFDFPATFVNGIAEYASASLLGSQSIQIRASGLLVKTRRGSSVLNRPDWSSTCVVATAPATSAPGELTTIALYAAGRWY